MIKNSFTITVDQESIAGLILSNGLCDAPKFVSIHGAGTSVKETILTVTAKPVIEMGSGILAVDLSGHGKSTGNLKESSLKKRVTEIKAAINRFSPKKELIVCGESMGGYIAIKMLGSYPIDTLILFCPALYDGQAYDVPFDQGFTEIIRRPESWKNTDVLQLLESFTGKLLVVMGEKDEVIPPGVIALIDKHAQKACKKEIYTIPNCPHKIDLWLASEPEELLKLQNKISEYLNV